MRFAISLLIFFPALAASAGEFEDEILPVLGDYCWDCHDPEDSDGDVMFLDAENLGDFQARREVWRSVAAQLRNRIMPPLDRDQPDDAEREFLVKWLEDYLKNSASEMPDYAGQVPPRRLNRREYENTVVELTGLRFGFDETLPADGGAGEGFDTNAQSLYLPSMLLERYLEAAQTIVDQAIITPPLDVTLDTKEFLPNKSGKLSDGDANALIPVYLAGEYKVELSFEGKANLELLVDGTVAEKVGEKRIFQVQLERGTHAIGLRHNDGGEVQIKSLRISQKPNEIDDKQRGAHRRLTGVEAGQVLDDARAHAQKQIRELLRRAWRRPIAAGEETKYLELYDRSAKRGDPFSESIKLALKGILVSPAFLYRMENVPASPGRHALGDHELASRLSYFLWSESPDHELWKLADAGKLQNTEILKAQVKRMIADKRSASFAEAFGGQWLGTKDVGGRIAPVHHKIYKKDQNNKDYTNEIASDMRAEITEFFHHLLTENRSALELLAADYAVVTGRLAKFYGLEVPKDFPEKKFQVLPLKDGKRGGLLGMGGVMAVTTHGEQTSPVIRGAWVFDTLLGDPVPPPPPGVPALKKPQKGKTTLRQELEQHRSDKACTSCHLLMDPIGFGLENYDGLGRWRETISGEKIDSSGVMPGGKKFNGPGQLKQLLLSREKDISRQLAKKVLGYALGRNLVSQDDKLLQELVDDMAKNNHGFADLVTNIVLSVPFRHTDIEANQN